MRLSIFASVAVLATFAVAETKMDGYSVMLPSVEVEGISEQDNLKGYITYDSAEVNRNGLSNKQTPQTIETIDIQKNRNYGTNDLSSILEGNAGIDAGYDMRGESIKIRGFSVDGGDIYRDGVRDSGQIRRSTANVERVEILKGPASILYGRSDGGAVVNLVSKKANFTPVYKVSGRYGSWSRWGLGADVNHAVNNQLAVRLTTDGERGKSWREGIKYKNFMISPSVIVTNQGGDVSFEAQYTYDNAWRVPDRTPTKAVYDKLGIDYKKGFSHEGDFVEDRLHFLRTELNAELAKKLNLKWVFGYRKASQNFDHFFAGSIVGGNRLRQNYAKQETDNETISNAFTLTKELNFERFKHNIAVGYDNSVETRHPRLWYSRTHMQDIDPYASRGSWASNRNVPLTTDNKHRAINHGVFFEDLISLDDTYRLMLGGRFDFYKFKTRNIRGQTNSYTGDSFSPRVGFLWDFATDHTAYVSYSQSFAPYGGRGNIGISTEDTSKLDLKPQNNVQYEIGLKSTWADNKFSSNIAVFQIEHKNIRYQPDPTNDPYTWAVRGKERSRGIELNVLGQIYENLYLRSSLGYTNAKVTKDNSNPLNEGLNLNETTRWQGNVFLRYVNADKWYVESGVTGYSKRYSYSTSGGRIQEQHLPGFARVDVSAGYSFTEHAQMTLAINNLFDKKYWRSSSRLGDERSFMMNFHYNF